MALNFFIPLPSVPGCGLPLYEGASGLFSALRSAILSYIAETL